MQRFGGTLFIWVLGFHRLPDEFSGFLVSVAGAVCLDPSPVDGGPPTLRVIGVEHVEELFAWELIAGSAVSCLVVGHASIGRADAPEGSALDLDTSSTPRRFAARVPLT